VKSIRNPRTLESLVARLERITPDAPARWGIMNAAEMLCHLGDAGDSVLQRRVAPGIVPARPLPLPAKLVMLYSPVPFPRGVETRPGINPKKEGTRPADFARDRARVIDGLRVLAAAPPGALTPSHFRFGKMSRRDWHHWAYKHVDHHLRQFAV
jgi:hypothetical protein